MRHLHLLFIYLDKIFASNVYFKDNFEVLFSPICGSVKNIKKNKLSERLSKGSSDVVLFFELTIYFTLAFLKIL